MRIDRDPSELFLFIAGVMIVLTGCIAALMGLSFAIFGPHPAFDPRQAYSRACTNYDKVPDTHGAEWTCTK